MIDRLLDSLDCGDTSNKHSSDIVGYVETIICSENHLIQVSTFSVGIGLKVESKSSAINQSADVVNVQNLIHLHSKYKHLYHFL